MAKRKKVSEENSLSYQDETDLSFRVEKGLRQFKEMYHQEAKIVSRAPGRAEVIGNHTDYNNGFALACGISRSTLVFLAPQNGRRVGIFSNSFPQRPLVLEMDRLVRNEIDKWVNYPTAVIDQLLKAGIKLQGTDILVDSNVPLSGGVSSSASFEVAVAKGLTVLYGENIGNLKLALVCKTAENSPLVESPCGFLDQGSVAAAKRGKFVFFDFQPKGDSPVSATKLVSGDITKDKLSFVIVVDNDVKRMLGETGYPARKKSCYDSLDFWSKKLGRKIASLRQVSVEEFLAYKDELEKLDGVMRMRVEHIIYENDRVLKATNALKTGKTKEFGNLLTESGRSALELYGLDERTPELTLLVNRGREIDGVWGMRNMGGGFSGIALALVENDRLPDFEEELGKEYKSKFGHRLEFIPFTTTNGAEILLS
ncbi:hypothetical protein HY345_00745 [Candidatus Microgenomates bacterium]|nr:hypothetical protein [Candidatus Microgenomates bacterium]